MRPQIEAYRGRRALLTILLKRRSKARFWKPEREMARLHLQWLLTLLGLDFKLRGFLLADQLVVLVKHHRMIAAATIEMITEP